MSEGEKQRRFEAMFRATYDRVFAYALRRTGSAEAEDVVAETYATAWRRFDVVPPDPLPWLYGVARRTLANSRRSWRRRIQLTSRLASEYDQPSATESDPGERIEEASLMRTALRSLNGSDREALMLVAWEGLDNGGAAAALGVSPQAFAVRLHRARRRLSDEIRRLSSVQPEGYLKEDR